MKLFKIIYNFDNGCCITNKICIIKATTMSEAQSKFNTWFEHVRRGDEHAEIVRVSSVNNDIVYDGRI